ncbi:MAG: UDP-N-acetyl-D-mannosamine dehydrogenase [Polyangiaceae bacterium]|nr:UDP-N-acetyl-D-mannosamine dehydrogenase [Polyangiaceae bacterium]
MSEPPSNKTVSVVGLGYIGLPTAAAFAARGVRVLGVDVNPQVVDVVNRAEVHIPEPELARVVRAAVREGCLRASGQPERSDAFLLAVPTPIAQDRSPDLSFVRTAASAVAPVLEAGNLVVLESTAPVGTTQQLAAWLAEARPDLTFPQQHGEQSAIAIAHCPERVLPGQILRELVHNDRVIGGMTPRCADAAATLYRIFARGELHLTDCRTAELSKLAENSYRDLNIAFANELSLLCDRLGIDVWKLIALANRHPRVEILRPGPGVGGHCIAVDPWFVVHAAPDLATLVRAARDVNDRKPLWVLDQVGNAIARQQRTHGRASRPVTVALLGLAFKPDVDDLRESPAVFIARRLAERDDVELCIVEPNITTLPPALTDRRLVALDEALARAEVVVVLVGHREFGGLDRALAPHQLVVDTVGLLERAGPRPAPAGQA